MKMTKDNVLKLLKKYGYLALVVVSMVGMAVIIAVSTIGGESGQVTPVDSKTSTIFFTPVANFTVAKDYCDDNLVYNSTLKQWEAHKSIDFKVADSSAVYAALSGQVTSVSTTNLLGTVITVDHGNGLTTRYASLDEEVEVKEGDDVSAGQKLGEATTSAGEQNLGSRLNFAVYKDGKAIDPNSYLSISDK